LNSEYRRLIGKFPDADAQLKQLFKVLCDIEDVAEYSASSGGGGRAVFIHCKHRIIEQAKLLQGPDWEDPVSALYGTYTVALQELKALLKAHAPGGQSKTAEEDGFKEVRRCKRHSSNESAPTLKKTVPTSDSAAVNTTFKDCAHPKLLRPPQSIQHGHRLSRHRGESPRRGNSRQNR
jgi:hypothetical protein